MSNVFFNLTNHSLTGAQMADVQAKGATVVELPEELKRAWGACTTENWRDLYESTLEFVINYEADEKACMIAGYAPLVFNLVSDFDRDGFEVLYADSKRESVEKVTEDGAVIKQNVFRHLGFYSQVTGERW